MQDIQCCGSSTILSFRPLQCALLVDLARWEALEPHEEAWEWVWVSHIRCMWFQMWGSCALRHKWNTNSCAVCCLLLAVVFIYACMLSKMQIFLHKPKLLKHDLSMQECTLQHCFCSVPAVLWMLEEGIYFWNVPHSNRHKSVGFAGWYREPDFHWRICVYVCRRCSLSNNLFKHFQVLCRIHLHWG